MNVVDIGCGVGDVSLLAARLVGSLWFGYFSGLPREADRNVTEAGNSPITGVLNCKPKQ